MLLKEETKKDVHEVQEPAQEDYYYLEEVRSAKTPPWRVSLSVLNTDISFKVDSGADVTAIPMSIYESIQLRPKLQPPRATIQGVGGKIDVQGVFEATVDHKNISRNIAIHVVRTSGCNALLSRSDAEAFGIIKFIEEVFMDVFGEFGQMKCEPVQIRLKPEVQPYHLCTPRRIPATLMKPAKEEIDRMLRHGVVSPITEPTDWCSPIVVALKPRTGKVRMCVDLKKFNMAVQRERFVMPHIDDLAAKLQGAVIFTTLDLSQAFWQIPLHQESRKFTCFITPFGRFVFNRLPYGLNNGTEIFQRTMYNILDGIDNVFINVDDILIFARNREQHDIYTAAALSSSTTTLVNTFILWIVC